MGSVESESPGFVVLTSQAGHGLSPLVFLREKPDNEVCRFRCGLRPRLNLALPSVDADGRAFVFYLVWLGGDLDPQHPA